MDKPKNWHEMTYDDQQEWYKGEYARLDLVAEREDALEEAKRVNTRIRQLKYDMEEERHGYAAERAHAAELRNRLHNQLHRAHSFIHEKGLTAEFNAWIHPVLDDDDDDDDDGNFPP
jgi:hypothetical protein